ncbi:MFS transporter, partial [Arthrobacter deserti]|nr:MFS transporter [Arthrobacter deserti]
NLAADLLRHPDFLRVFAGRFLLALTYSLVATYLLYLLEDYLGLSAGEAAAFAGLVLVVVLASSAPAMWIGPLASDRIRRRKPSAAGSAALMAAVLAIPLLFPSRGAVLVFAVLFGLGFGVFNAVGDALATQVLPQGRERAGRDLGVLNIAAALPQVAAPAIGWAAVSLTGGYAGLFMLGICAAAAGTWAVTGVRSGR